MKKITSILITSLLAFICVYSVANAYTVVSGDTMWKIAQNANLRLSELIRVNPQISNPNVIYPGQEINTGNTLGTGGNTTSSAPSSNVPYLNYNNVWTRSNTFNATTTFNGSNTFNGTTTFNVRPLGSTGFGGDGSDGILTISSGTTTIDLGGANVFVKNYSAISITGTGTLDFINPSASGTNIILKSRGDVTLTSTNSINLINLGSATGTNAYGLFALAGHGLDSENMTTGSVLSSSIVSSFSQYINPKIYLVPGSSGGSSNNQSGGRGSGSLLIEVGGSLNKTGNIYASGSNGASGVCASNLRPSAGGAGGIVVILYNNLISNSGSINTTGGTGGSGYNLNSCGTCSSGGAYSGAGGGSNIFSGTNGGAGSNCFVASSGNGANGFSLVAKNTEF